MQQKRAPRERTTIDRRPTHESLENAADFTKTSQHNSNLSSNEANVEKNIASTTNRQNVAPLVVFIVPYRNRMQHKFFFSKYMSDLLKTNKIRDSYEVYFAHQHDDRAFNRGGTKNIGFMAVRDKYPNDYKNITFVFNDIDTIPFADLFDYTTIPGIVKHFYGFTYALGGIVAMNGCDFERINGFPAYWGWGMEDNVLQNRCDSAGLVVDRSNFYKIGSPQILQLFDGVSRIINKDDPWREKTDNGMDGICTIQNLNFAVSHTSTKQTDNDVVFDGLGAERIYFVNISYFDAYSVYDSENLSSYDLRGPPRRYVNPIASSLGSMTVSSTRGAGYSSFSAGAHSKSKTNSVTDPDWTYIPHVDSALDKLNRQVDQLKRAGKPIPKKLIKRISELIATTDPMSAPMQQMQNTDNYQQGSQSQKHQYHQQYYNHYNPNSVKKMDKMLHANKAQSSLFQRVSALGSMH